MPSCSIHFKDGELDRLDALRTFYNPQGAKPLSRSEFVRDAIAEYAASRAVEASGDDLLAGQLFDLERSAAAIQRLRARCVAELRARKRKYPGQTAITDPIDQED
jgi:hypothetical protein